MIVDFKTDELTECVCGYKPGHYSVAYGRTPYDVFCPTCKKQTTMAKCKITGWAGNVIDYWNKHIAKMTKEQMSEEVKNLISERKEKDPYNEYKNYEYYWEKDNGEVFYGRC